MINKRLTTQAAVCVLCSSLTACGGGATGNGDSGLAIPPHNLTATRSDALGDTISGPGTRWDITAVRTTLVEGPFRNEYETLEVAVTFAQDVTNALPGPGQTLIGKPDLLGVEIFLNIDGSDATGTTTFQCSSVPNLPGIDAAVDSGGAGGRRADGSYPVVDANGYPQDEASVSVSGKTVTYSINLAAWGAPATGIPRTRVAVAAYNGSTTGSAVTDCAPDSGTMSASGT